MRCKLHVRMQNFCCLTNILLVNDGVCHFQIAYAIMLILRVVTSGEEGTNHALLANHLLESFCHCALCVSYVDVFDD
jgi:hypothetical protein